MTLRVGIVGCGAMGRIHLRNLLARSEDVTVAGVFDPNHQVLTSLDLPETLQIFPDAKSLVTSDDVHQVIVASPAGDHFGQVMGAIERGKPVYCEKPLTTTLAQSREIREAEAGQGRALVWVGFMRRFDPLYLALKADVSVGRVGEVVYAQMSHRNPSVPPTFSDADYMLETFIHEFDITRWLIEVDISAVEIVGTSVETTTGLADPQFVHVTTAEGQKVVIDGHINNGYGYDIRCEVVGQKGSLSLAHYSEVEGISSEPHENWGVRFQAAYRACLNAWVDDVLTGHHTGVTSEDSEHALVVSLAGIEAQRRREPVEIAEIYCR